MQTLIKELHEYINKMDEYQLRFILSLIKKLFD